MAKIQTVTMIDDTDKSDATQTVNFALDGVNYEIDLNDNNANNLRNSLDYWIKHARKVTGRRRRTAAPRLNAGENQKIRDWAKANNKHVADRGRIPVEIVNEYRAAMQNTNQGY